MMWPTFFPELKRTLARVASGLSALTLAAAVLVLPACGKTSDMAAD